jgi:urease accessory protein
MLDVGRWTFDIHSPDNGWLLWQLADSAFPSGGFAHSNGLEAAWQNSELKNSTDLSAWLEASLSQFCRASLPFVTAIHTPSPLNLNLPPSHFLELDHLCDSFLTNHVANRASRVQGRAFLASAQRIFALPELDSLSNSSASPSAPEGHCFHLAPVFGLVTRALGINHDSASRLFMFLHLRGILAAAVRLGLVGPLEAQSIQHRLGPRCEALLARFASLTLDDLAQTAPLLDLWQGTQDRLYSRLFQS